MTEDKSYEIMKELTSLPKPELQRDSQEQMLSEILQFSAKYTYRKRWGIVVKRTVIGILTAAALLTLSIIGIEILQDNNELDRNQIRSQQEIKDSENPESREISEKGYYYDSILEEHQVALDDLYVWIPERKETVSIDRKVSDGYVIVNISDKETNELLLTYGESLGDESVKEVFREINTDGSKVRLHAFVEIDSATNLINSVKDTNVSFDPIPYKVDSDDRIFAYSITGSFPTEQVQIRAWMNVKWDADKVQFENIFETYDMGVINK